MNVPDWIIGNMQNVSSSKNDIFFIELEYQTYIIWLNIVVLFKKYPLGPFKIKCSPSEKKMFSVFFVDTSNFF